MANDDFLEAIDRLNRKLEEPLSEVEIGILRAAWEDIPYTDAGTGMQGGTLRNIASLLWKRLSKATGVSLNKGNFQEKILQGVLEACQMFGAVPAPVGPFYGREREMKELATSLQRFKILSLIGMDGVGKRTLMSRFVREKLTGFNAVLWFADWHGISSADEFWERLTALPQKDLWEKKLSARRSLLVVEQAEQMLIGTTGDRRLKTDYYNLLVRVARQTQHSIVLIAREPLGQLSSFEVAEAVEMPLKGLSLADSRHIFEDFGLDNRQIWDDIVLSVGGHPLQLMKFAAYVSERFEGKLSKDFLRTTIKLSILQAFYNRLFNDSLSDTDRRLLSEVAGQQVSLLDLLGRYPAQEIDRLLKATYLKQKDGHLVFDSILLERYLQSESFICS